MDAGELQIGQLTDVTSVTVGTETVAPNIIGDKVLSVYDSSDFDDQGGFLIIFEDVGTTYTLPYVGKDDDLNTITLLNTLTVAVEAETQILISPVGVEKWAQVLVDGEEDVILARIPYRLSAAIDEGIRDPSEYESVIVQLQGSEYVVTDMPGKLEYFDGSGIDPSTYIDPVDVSNVISDVNTLNTVTIPAINSSVSTLQAKFPVNTVDIAANAITSAQITNGAVVTAAIGPGAVVTSKIAAGAVTANEIAAGTITANKLSVIIGGGNIVPDSSYENTLNTGSGWTANGTTTAARDTAQHWQGLGALKVVATSENWGYYQPNGAVQGGVTKPNLTFGTKYSASIWVYSSTAQNLCLTDYGTANVQGPSVAVPATTWTRLTLPGWTPLSPSVFLSVRDPARVATIGTVWLDGFQIELGDVPTAYSPMPDEILPGTIVTNMLNANVITSNEIAANTILAGDIAAGTITSNEIAANTITAANIAALTITAAQIAALSISADRLVANSITAAQIAALTITANEIAANTITAGKIAANTITAAQIAANTITVDKMLIGISTNAIANPGFENGAASPHTAQNGGSLGVATANYRSGIKCGLVVTGTARGVGSYAYDVAFNGSILNPSVAIPVSVGDTIYGECWFRDNTATGATAAVFIDAFDLTGTRISNPIGNQVTLTGSYQKSSCTYTVGAGVGYVMLVIGTANVGAGASYLIDDAHISKQVTGSLLVNGAIDGKTINAATFNTIAGVGLGVQGMQMSGDTSGGVLKFWTGDAAETGAGWINPTGSSTLEIANPNTAFGRSKITLGPSSIVLAPTAGGFVLAQKELDCSASIHSTTGGLWMDDLNGGGTTGANIGNGGRVTRTSSIKMKEAIKDMTEAEAHSVLGLKSYTFKFKQDSIESPNDPRRYPGFIAEQAAEVGAELWVGRQHKVERDEDGKVTKITRDKNGEIIYFRTGEMTVAHNMLIQELFQELDQLKTKVAELSAT